MPDRPALHYLVPDGRSADAYGPRFAVALHEAGWTVAAQTLPGASARGDGPRVDGARVAGPRVDESAILAADIAVSRLPDGAWVLVDGLALPAVAGGIASDSRRLRLVALVDGLLWREPGLPADEAAALRHLEQGALALMRRVVVPSAEVAAEVAALGLADAAILVAPADRDGAGRLGALFGA